MKEGVINCHSGMDVGVYQGTERIGTANGVAWSITREMAPVYAMNNGGNVASFRRGKKGIAGTIIFHDLDSKKILGNEFNIRIKSADEHGTIKTMAITGLELINEGSSADLASAELETQHTWVARDLIPWD